MQLGSVQYFFAVLLVIGILFFILHEIFSLLLFERRLSKKINLTILNLNTLYESRSELIPPFLKLENITVSFFGFFKEDSYVLLYTDSDDGVSIRFAVVSIPLVGFPIGIYGGGYIQRVCANKKHYTDFFSLDRLKGKPLLYQADTVEVLNGRAFAYYRLGLFSSKRFLSILEGSNHFKSEVE